VLLDKLPTIPERKNGRGLKFSQNVQNYRVALSCSVLYFFFIRTFHILITVKIHLLPSSRQPCQLYSCWLSCTLLSW